MMLSICSTNWILLPNTYVTVYMCWVHVRHVWSRLAKVMFADGQHQIQQSLPHPPLHWLARSLWKLPRPATPCTAILFSPTNNAVSWELPGFEINRTICGHKNVCQPLVSLIKLTDSPGFFSPTMGFFRVRYSGPIVMWRYYDSFLIQVKFHRTLPNTVLNAKSLRHITIVPGFWHKHPASQTHVHATCVYMCLRGLSVTLCFKYAEFCPDFEPGMESVEYNACY